MKLAIVFLNKIEFLDDILAAFLEIGVRGATVIDSVGMGHIISQHIPIFAGLRDAFAGSSPNNKIILAVVEERMVKKISGIDLPEKSLVMRNKMVYNVLMKERQTLFFESPYQVSIHREAIPTPVEGQVLVRTELSAISAGTEMLFYRGQFPTEMAIDESIAPLQKQRGYPIKYGYAAVGRVEELGENAPTSLLGQRVFSFQVHQSYFTALVSSRVWLGALRRQQIRLPPR